MTIRKAADVVADMCNEATICLEHGDGKEAAKFITADRLALVQRIRDYANEQKGIAWGQAMEWLAEKLEGEIRDAG